MTGKLLVILLKWLKKSNWWYFISCEFCSILSHTWSAIICRIRLDGINQRRWMRQRRERGGEERNRIWQKSCTNGERYYSVWNGTIIIQSGQSIFGRETWLTERNLTLLSVQSAEPDCHVQFFIADNFQMLFNKLCFFRYHASFIIICILTSFHYLFDEKMQLEKDIPTFENKY